MTLTPGRMSGREMERLGDRLRTAPVPDRVDLDLLQKLRREYDQALGQAQRQIAEATGVAPTTRLKTVQTLIDKLRRHSTMHLHQVQDVAGARIVRDMTLSEQDELVTTVAALFPGSKVVDRRPEGKRSHGYRAVHVIAKVDGRSIEVQIRTTLQDRWAQIVERLGDAWGRQIRYGEAPSDPRQPVGPATRTEVWQSVQTISAFIAACEEDPAIQCTVAYRALRRLSVLMAAEETR